MRVSIPSVPFMLIVSVFWLASLPVVHAFEPPDPSDLESAEDLRYFTEQYPPYNYKRNGKLQGLMIDTWEAMWDRMGANLDRNDIVHAPWARCYHELKTWPGTSVAVMTYTDDRAEYMKFVGPLVEVRFVLFARKDKNIELNSLQDATEYTIGTVREDIGEKLLIGEGLDVENFERLEGPAQAAKLLKAGRIDLWSYQEDVARFEMAEEGLDMDNYEAVYVVDRSRLMAAFHKETPDALIADFQDALDGLKRTGKMDAIIERHLER